MKKIHRSEFIKEYFWEEYSWIVKCPECGAIITVREPLYDETNVECEECGTVFKLISD